jgi:hypothetical protein
MNKELFYDPALRATTIASEIGATADAISSQLGLIMAEVDDDDPSTATGRDARLIAIFSALGAERTRLRRIADHVRGLAIDCRDLAARGAA